MLMEKSMRCFSEISASPLGGHCGLMVKVDPIYECIDIEGRISRQYKNLAKQIQRSCEFKTHDVPRSTSPIQVEICTSCLMNFIRSRDYNGEYILWCWCSSRSMWRSYASPTWYGLIVVASDEFWLIIPKSEILSTSHIIFGTSHPNTVYLLSQI